jgi:hypothetical protein
VPRGNQGIAGIVTFARIAHDQSGPREKLANEAGQLCPDGFHEHIGGDAAGKCLLLESEHAGAGEKHALCSTRAAAG